mgnify:CR=1 FL=1
MRAEVGRRDRDFAISIHINLFLLGCCGKFPFSIFSFLFHFLFLGFCLLVDFDLLENGAPIFLSQLKISGIAKVPIVSTARGFS